MRKDLTDSDLDPAINEARSETALEIAKDILVAINAGLTRHGDDPANYLIAATALADAVNALNAAHPKMTTYVMASLIIQEKN